MRLGVRCDVGQSVGVGHVMRCASLAEEFVRHGWTVEFAADVTNVPIALSRIAAAGFEVSDPPTTATDHVAWAVSSAIDAVLLDSYTLPRDVSRTLLDSMPLVTLIDGHTRGQAGSLYVDQNYGAQLLRWPTGDEDVSTAALRLAGTQYALISDAFARLRPDHPPVPSERLRLLVALGGTDARGLTEQVVRAVELAGVPLSATVISKDAESMRRRYPSNSEVEFEFLQPTAEMPYLLANSSAVIGAAGSSLWEAACLGVPTGAILVAGNQREAYESLVADALIHGLGDVDSSGFDVATLGAAITHYLLDGPGRRETAVRMHRLVDGAGKARVFDEFNARVVHAP